MDSAIRELESVESNGVVEDPGAPPIALLSKKSRTTSIYEAMRSLKNNLRNPASVGDLEARRQAAQLKTLRDRVCQAITGEVPSIELRARCVAWYSSYLEHQIGNAWSQIGEIIIYHGSPQSADCAPEALIQVHKILLRIISFLQKYDEEDTCTLDSLVRDLESDRLIRDHGFQATQMVFIFIGWLSALYSPSIQLCDGKFSLKEGTRGTRRHRLLRSPVIRSTSINSDNAKAPFYRLLSRFGCLLPKVECVRRTVRVGGLEAGSECIISSYVSYQNLKHIQNVRIEWVDTLAQHLEFDQRNNILRIFRLPSICRLMYRDQGDTILFKLFEKHQKEAAADIPHGRNPHNFEPSFEDFLVEVLLSYRLIFGRSSRSRAGISHLLSCHKAEWQKACVYDPLLEILCTEDKNSDRIKEIYNDLEAAEFEDYISVDEFPFLGRRLIDIQQFSMGQNPHSLRRLWYDRRNIGTWFAIWAVVIFGGGTLIVQIFQLLFQIWQPLQGH